MYYTLEENVHFLLPFRGTSFYEDEFITYHGGELTVRAGYSWNGCSPKFEIFDVVIGTPEGIRFGKYSKTFFPSLVHDIMYQLHLCTRKEADLLFLEMMKLQKFKLSYLYYLVVRLFGRKAWG